VFYARLRQFRLSLFLFGPHLCQPCLRRGLFQVFNIGP
jgi:hypothetical protein